MSGPSSLPCDLDTHPLISYMLCVFPYAWAFAPDLPSDRIHPISSLPSKSILILKARYTSTQSESPCSELSKYLYWSTFHKPYVYACYDPLLDSELPESLHLWILIQHTKFFIFFILYACFILFLN